MPVKLSTGTKLKARNVVRCSSGAAKFNAGLDAVAQETQGSDYHSGAQDTSSAKMSLVEICGEILYQFGELSYFLYTFYMLRRMVSIFMQILNSKPSDTVGV